MLLEIAQAQFSYAKVSIRNIMPRKARYKPLLFTTTVRNPERLKNFLSVLKEYDGQVLKNDVAEKIAGKIIRRRIRPISAPWDINLWTDPSSPV